MRSKLEVRNVSLVVEPNGSLSVHFDLGFTAKFEESRRYLDPDGAHLLARLSAGQLASLLVRQDAEVREAIVTRLEQLREPGGAYLPPIIVETN